MENTIQKLAKGQDSMKTQLTLTDNKLQNIFLLGWTYVGRGYEVKFDEYAHIPDISTLTQCLDVCDGKHASEDSWNGVVWGPGNHWCGCVKNDSGHRGSDSYLHFKKQ